MPTADGLRKGLERMGAKKEKVVWISMREEPVILINGKPHVLRLVTDPFENVVQTGITTDIVEAMESALSEFDFILISRN